MRELRVQSRKRATYRARVGWGLAVLLWLGFYTWSFPHQSANGRNVLSLIHACLAVMLFVLAPIGVADAISREKREGTLGLLLLTELTATQVVMGKLAAHLVRLVYFVLMMLPFIMVPVLLGGVEFQDFLLSSVILFSIVAAGVSAGLVASALFVGFGAALAWSLILGALFTLVIGSSVVNGLFAIFPSTFPEPMPLWLRIFAFGPGLMMFPVQVRDIAGIFFAARSAFWVTEAGLILFSLSFLGFAVKFCARRVSRHAEFAGETKKQETFRRAFLTPVFWRNALRRSMSRKLDRNPFIWLEYRTAGARAARWAMVLLIVAAETILVTFLPNQEEFFDMNFVMLWVLVAFLAIKTSSSFQRERECGAFELLLVTPLTEKKLLAGRLLAVARYYSLPVSMLATFGVIGLTWTEPPFTEDARLSGAVHFTSLCASLLSVPFCGLFFALRCRSFLTALLCTVGIAILAPLCLWFAGNGLLWMAASGGRWPLAILLENTLRGLWWPVLLGVVGYHLLAAYVTGRATLRLLGDREFEANL